jgi:uncharacterized membrane protein
MKSAVPFARGLGWFSIGLGLAETLASRPIARWLGARNENCVRLCGLRELAVGVGLLSSRKPAGWLWARVVGDAIDLALLGDLLESRRRRSHENVASAAVAVAGVTALDAWCAWQLSRRVVKPEHVVRSITIGRPAAELYEHWLDPHWLAQIMGHVATVVPAGPRRTFWTLKIPGGKSLSWHSEIVDEKPGHLLRWHADERDPIISDGVVRLEPAPAERGTVVTLNFRIAPRGGRAGNIASHLLGPVPEALTMRALRRFKSLVETGEIPTLEKNPAARSGAAANLV